MLQRHSFQAADRLAAPAEAHQASTPARRYAQTRIFMDTAVAIEIVDPPSAFSDAACAEAVNRAFEWFARVEASCSRFDPQSELRRLCARPGEAVTVSPLLFEALRFASEVAVASNGALDPTVGATLERAGFARNYRTGEWTPSGLDPAREISYRDMLLDAATGTVTLQRPLMLDLGAVAKGLAIDVASQELEPFPSFAIDAGGDVIVRGHDGSGAPWRIGVRHPRSPGALIDAIEVPEGTKLAVCTSGDYERTAGATHHIVDPRPRTDGAPRDLDDIASVTVVAPTAMLADALATAAFVLGPTRGLQLLSAQGVEGLLVLPSLTTHSPAGFARLRSPS